jgi:Ca2+-binding RTX toxin-like protein
VSRLSRTLTATLGAFVLGALSLVLPASPAAAATTPSIVEVGDGYHFVGADGDDTVTLSIVGGRILVHDESATSFGFIGSKCVAVPAASGASVSCKLKSPTVFHADLGGGTDILDAGSLPKLVRIDVRTGAGVAQVTGGAGNDVIRGQSDNFDILAGGDGNDRLTAGYSGIMDGGAGNDIFVGGPAGDSIVGGPGDDYVRSGEGFDTVSGGAGNDGLSGDGAGDLLFGGPGNDQVYGGEGNDQLTGDAGRDNILGNQGDDTINAVDNARDGGDCGGGTDVLNGDAPTVFLGIPTGGDLKYFNNCETVNQF